MTHLGRLGFTPYGPGDAPAAGSVPVSVVILTRDEAMNVPRVLTSTAWAAQRIVLDSGSTDDTAKLAAEYGATVVHRAWDGYAQQREAALHLGEVQHDWVYFVDADEWVSAQLAQEIATALTETTYVAFRQRRRFVFLGAWIQHSGWYEGSWMLRLMDRRAATFSVGSSYGERASVTGPVGTLTHDLVDHDLKGLDRWLAKHVAYARLEAEQRAATPGLRHRLADAWLLRNDRPLARSLAKEVVWTYVPLKPLMLFLYMYVLRAGYRDGQVGLQFAVLRGWWFEYTVQALMREPRRADLPLG